MATRLCKFKKHEYDASLRRCPTCQKEYNTKYQAKYHLEHREERLAAQKARYLANKEACANRKRMYVANNKEKVSKANSIYYFKNKSRIQAAAAKRYEENKEAYLARCAKWKAANPDKALKWRQENTYKITAASNKRRAAKLNATPKWLSKEQLNQITEIYAASAQLTDISGTSHHVDHIVPLQGKTVCGLHVPWNLRVIPAKENIKKKNRLITDV